MADKSKKIDKEFQLSDSSVNCYGFRLLTSGYLIDEYKSNPIGYYMHDRDSGVVVRWEDLKVDGDKVLGKPVINMSNPRGQQTVDEIENKFLNGASVGHIVVLEWSDDPKMKLPGQIGPTATKWFNRETSVVDVPGNFGSLALFDKDGNPINLADFKNQSQSIITMKQIFLTAEQITKLNLKADPTQADVDTAIDNLRAEVAKVPDLQSKLTAAENAKKKAEDDLAALNKTVNEKRVNDLVAAALTDKKITKEAGEKLKVDYKNNADGLESLIAALPKYVSVNETLADKSKQNEAILKLTWDELDKQGLLEDLKAKNIEVFKEKYKEQFKKDYAG
jgi:hypothetical protein